MHLLETKQEIKDYIINLTTYLPQINVKCIEGLSYVIDLKIKARCDDSYLNENFNLLIKSLSTIPKEKVTIYKVSDFFIYYNNLIKAFNLDFHPLI